MSRAGYARQRAGAANARAITASPHPVMPRAWFLVPRFVIDDAIEKIRDGSITEYNYDPTSAALVRRSDTDRAGSPPT